MDEAEENGPRGTNAKQREAGKNHVQSYQAKETEGTGQRENAQLPRTISFKQSEREMAEKGKKRAKETAKTHQREREPDGPNGNEAKGP